MRRLLPLLALLCLFGCGARAGTHTACGGKQASALLWFQELTGTLGGRSAAGAVSAAITGRSDAEPGFALTLKTLGSLCLDLSYTPLSLDTRFSSSGSFTFGNASFGTVTNGQMRYRMPVWEGALRWIALDNDLFRVSVAACLKMADADVQLTANGIRGTFDHLVPIPMAGISGQANVTPWFKAYGSFKLLDMDVGPVQSKAHDWELGVIADWSTSFKTIRVATGWRELGMDLTAQAGQPDETRIDVTHSGPFVEATFSF
ncbi:MAG: hypothetical protein HY815_31990 [Candidatus Riflebacteria bacterium]|nr:hypothetical protein [Candidatus Riflebacteria bacterium]